MSKKKLKIDLEMMANYTGALEIELQLSHDEIGYSKKANLALQETIEKLSKHIEMLDRQLIQCDNAIIRKDRQFEGLKACYKDDLANGRLG